MRADEVAIGPHRDSAGSVEGAVIRSTGHVSTWQWLPLVGLIVSLWLWSWLPQTIDLIVIGRQVVSFGESPQRSAQAAVTYQVIMFSIAALSAILIGRSAISGDRVFPLPLLICAAAWSSLNGLYVLDGGRNLEALLFLPAVAAIGLNFRSFGSAFTTVRALIVVTAVASIGLGLWAPDTFLSDPRLDSLNEKALVGARLLNGLMPTANQLGVTLLLGLPLVLTRGKKVVRVACAIVCVVAMVWASSRTSLIGLAAIGVALASLRLLRSSTSLIAGIIVASLGAFATLAPLVFTNPEDFSRRVAIWTATFDYVANGHLLVGGGWFVYRQLSPITASVGAVTGTGHNIFVTALGTGGILGLVAVVVAIGACSYAAIALASVDARPLLFMVALSAVAVFEDPLRGLVIAPSSFVVLPLLAIPPMLFEYNRFARKAQTRQVAKF